MNSDILKKFDENPEYKRVREELARRCKFHQDSLNELYTKIQLWDSINGVDVWDDKGGKL